MSNDMTIWIKAAGVLSAFFISASAMAMDNIEAEANTMKRIPPPPPGAYQSLALIDEAREVMMANRSAAPAANASAPVYATNQMPMQPMPPVAPAPLYAPPGYDPERAAQEMMQGMQREYRALQRESQQMQAQMPPAYAPPQPYYPQGPSQWQAPVQPTPPAWVQSAPAAPAQPEWANTRPQMPEHPNWVPAMPPQGMTSPPWAQGMPAMPQQPTHMPPPPWVLEMQRQMRMYQPNGRAPVPPVPWGQSIPVPNG